MGLLQAAYLTYENQMHTLGNREEYKELLTPISHMIQNAQIEITINADGEFVSASSVGKKDSKTIIPVTIESANRTGENSRAHPLSDQLRYLAAFGGDKFEAYISELEKWAESKFTHPKVQAVLTYIKSGNIVADLAEAEVIKQDEKGWPVNGKIEAYEYVRCLVRWRVIPFTPAACWADKSLYKSYIAYYADTCAGAGRDICIISGEEDMVCDMHPKGVIGINFGAKLISSNDSAGFTYRGRFSQASQACSVGYKASQKAHAALRWLSANYGVVMGGRTFLCWTLQKNVKPPMTCLGSPFGANKEPEKFISYKQQLVETIGSYKQSLLPGDNVIIAAMDAATTGRLSVTYYNEFKASDFLERLEDWYNSFCWSYGKYTQSPSLREIVNFAFGVQQSVFVETNEKILCEHVQRLLRCVVDKQPIPYYIVRTLAAKAGSPASYTANNHRRLVLIACAVIRKYYNDKQNREVWKLGLDKSSTDRGYLFGRLLAVAELAERMTYNKEEKEKRQTNAMRVMTVFARRPMNTWKILRESLVPYFAHLEIGSRIFYEKLIDEIFDMIDEKDINKELDSVYLLGYSHQRTAIFNSGKVKIGVEDEYEPAE